MGEHTLLTAEELRSDPLTVFSLMGKLGEGSYGAVHKAMHNRTSTVVAIKMIPIEGNLEESVKEIDMMMDCKSKYVVRFHGSYTRDDYLWIVMEFCGAGSVSDVMRLVKNTLTEPQIACICRNVLKGLSYLHERRRIHRDIKAGNILLNSKGEAKLADFGVAGQLSDNVTKRQTVIGTPFWMAPEVIQEVGYGVLADVWSLGITCIEMAQGRPPYHKIHPMRAIFMIPTRPAPTLEDESLWSKEFISFLARCLTKDPEMRPSAADLLKDPFIKKAANSSVLTNTISEALDLIASGALEIEDEVDEVPNGDDDDDDGECADGTFVFHGTSTLDGTVKKIGTSKVGDKYDAATIVVGKKSGGTLAPKTVLGFNSDSEEDDDNSTMIRVPTLSGGTVKASKKKVDDATMKTSKKKDSAVADATIKIGKGKTATSSKDYSSSTQVIPSASLKSKHEFAAKTLKPTTDSASSLENLEELLKLVEINMEKELQATHMKYERKRAPILEAIEAKKLVISQSPK